MHDGDIIHANGQTKKFIKSYARDDEYFDQGYLGIVYSASWKHFMAIGSSHSKKVSLVHYVWSTLRLVTSTMCFTCAYGMKTFIYNFNLVPSPCHEKFQIRRSASHRQGLSQSFDCVSYNNYNKFILVLIQRVTA